MQPPETEIDEELFEQLMAMDIEQLKAYILKKDPRIQRHLPTDKVSVYFEGIFQDALFKHALYLNTANPQSRDLVPCGSNPTQRAAIDEESQRAGLERIRKWAPVLNWILLWLALLSLALATYNSLHR